eukprot:6211196-Pleurochrysis_carterae.AAC.5
MYAIKLLRTLVDCAFTAARAQRGQKAQPGAPAERRGQRFGVPQVKTVQPRELQSRRVVARALPLPPHTYQNTLLQCYRLNYTHACTHTTKMLRGTNARMLERTHTHAQTI